MTYLYADGTRNRKLMTINLIPVLMHHEDIFRDAHTPTTALVNIWVGHCFHRGYRAKSSADSMGNVLLSAYFNYKVSLPMTIN